jgi:uncharacterized circularly permuted ATP-grasp superfamily protein
MAGKRSDRWEVRVDHRVGATVNEVFLKIPPSEARELFRAVEAECVRRGLVYEESDGTRRPISLMMRPRVLVPEQRRYFHKVCLEMMRALERLPAIYAQHAEVRELLPFTEEETAWLESAWPKSSRAPQTVFGRLDASVDFADLDWDEEFSFFEINSVGVGGVYYTPVAEQVINDVVSPHMKRHAPGLVLKENDDYRQLLLERVTHHARAIGCRRINVALVQDMRSVGGALEHAEIAKYFGEQGLTTVCCDPRDLEVRGGDLVHRGVPVDILYRDTELRDLLEMQRAGDDLSATKLAFAQNRVVSSLAGEFDHKSVWEILTDSRFDDLFTQRQRKFFRKHVLWTRLVFERRTTGPDEGEIDLVRHIRRNKDVLVMKPNRAFGGEGLYIGPHVDLSEWDRAIEHALAAPGTWVVQRYVEPVIKDFPVLSADGGISLEEFYVVCGFTATPDGIAMLGRASKRRVVNVALKGGLTAILVLL